MEEAPENGKESSHSAHGKGIKEFYQNVFTSTTSALIYAINYQQLLLLNNNIIELIIHISKSFFLIRMLLIVISFKYQYTFKS